MVRNYTSSVGTMSVGLSLLELLRTSSSVSSAVASSSSIRSSILICESKPCQDRAEWLVQRADASALHFHGRRLLALYSFRLLPQPASFLEHRFLLRSRNIRHVVNVRWQVTTSRHQPSGCCSTSSPGRQQPAVTLI